VKKGLHGDSGSFNFDLHLIGKSEEQARAAGASGAMPGLDRARPTLEEDEAGAGPTNRCWHAQPEALLVLRCHAPRAL